MPLESIDRFATKGPSPAATAEATDRLDSWKEIAVYLRREVRTVQLWERHEGLPVRRHSHRQRGSVFAFRSELANWLQTRVVPPARIRPLLPNGRGEIKRDLAFVAAREGDDRECRTAAYACMIGRYFWNQRGGQGLTNALRYFRDALIQDARCADAHAGIADCYVSLSFHHLIPRQEAIQAGTAAALAAVQYDSASTDSLSAYANVLMSFHWDWEAAQSACEDCRARNTASPQVMVLQSMLATIQNRDLEAIRFARTASSLATLTPAVVNTLASAYYYAGRFGESIETALQTIEMQPNLMMGHVRLGLAHTANANWQAAAGAFANASPLTGARSQAQALMAYVHAMDGQHGVANDILRGLSGTAAEECVPFVDIAAAHLALNEPGLAMAYLKRAWIERDMRCILLHRDPRFYPLHDRSAFWKLTALNGPPPEN